MSREGLCLFKVFDWFTDLTRVKINLYSLDGMAGFLNTLYKTRHCASQLDENVNALRNNMPDDVDDYDFSFSDHLRYNMAEI